MLCRRRVHEQASHLLSEIDNQLINEAFWGFYIGLRSTLTTGEIKMEKRLVGLTPEELAALAKQIEATLHAQPPDNPTQSSEWQSAQF